MWRCTVGLGALDFSKNRDTFILKGKAAEEYWSAALWNTEKAQSIETSVTTHTTSLRHIPKDSAPHQYR
jgi:hypothetical protein